MSAQREKEVVIGIEDFRNRIKKSTEYANQPVDITDVMTLLKENDERLKRIEKATCSEIESEKNGYTFNESLINIKQENKSLLKEIDIVKHKLEYCIPVHSIVYMTVSAVVFGVFTTLFILQLLRVVELWDIRFSFGICFASIGLFITAFLSLKDWRKFLDEKQ